MPKNILVIGGTRFFGKLLVQRLVRAGHHVTIASRAYAPDPFGERITRVRVDRRNEQAMQAAFGGKRFDIVYDQMCHSPLDAAISSRVFKGHVSRYIMTSTVDVYRALEPQSQAFDEESLHVDAQPIDSGHPWHDPARAGASQVAGKVQAEAYLYRAGGMPVVTVRMAHVLGGVDDYTGRLAHYVDQVRLGAVLPYTSARARTSFIEAREAADFLVWAGAQEFTGPVNAGADGALSAYELHGRVAAALQAPARTRKVATGAASPFDLLTSLVLDTSRAKSLGYRFSHVDDWIDSAILQHDLAHV